MSFISRIKIEDLINNGYILVHKDGNHGAKYPRAEEFGVIGVPFLSAKLLDDAGNIDLINAPRLANDKAKNFTFGFVQTEDVLLSHNATVGRVAVMPKVDEPVLIGTSLTHFRLNKSKILPTYFAAYFSSRDFQNQLAAVMSQTTRNQVPITSQRQLYVDLPSLDIQKRIMQHIDCIDHKININNQINQTLESIAQAIFKSWFIDFEPVRAKITAKLEGQDPEVAAMCAISGKNAAEIEQMSANDFAELKLTAALFPDELIESDLVEVPRGYKIGCVGDISTVKGGFAFKSSQFVKIGHPVIKIKNITGNGEVNIEDTQCIEKKTAKNASRFILCDGNLVMAMTGATVGKIGLINTYGKSIYLNQRVAKFESENFGDKISYFLFCLFNRKEYFEQIVGTAQGSAQPNISSTGIESIKLIVPSSNLIINFIGKVDIIFQLWLKNGSNNCTLREVKNNLLPKLLSGEIDVSMLEDIEHGIS